MVKTSTRITTTIKHPKYSDIEIIFYYYTYDNTKQICPIIGNKVKINLGKISLYIYNVSIRCKYIFNDQLYLGLRIKTNNEETFKIISNGDNAVFSENQNNYRTLECNNITSTTESIELDIKVYIDKDTADKFDKDIHEFNSLTNETKDFEKYFKNIREVEKTLPPLETDFSKLNVNPLEGFATKKIYFIVINDQVLIPQSKKAKII